MYNEIEPFGEIRQDYRVASILQMLYNINRGKNQQAKKLDEFLLSFGESVEEKTKKKQTPEQQFAMLKILSAMHANDAIPVPEAQPEGPRSAEEQAALEADIAAQLSRARKAMN